MLKEKVASDRGYHLSDVARRGIRRRHDLELDKYTQWESPISGSGMKSSASTKHQTTDAGQVIFRIRKGQQNNVSSKTEGREHKGIPEQMNVRHGENQSLGSRGLTPRAKAHGNHRQGCSRLSESTC